MIFRARLDLPLNRDGSVRFLPWIVALMVYLASLALAGTLVVRDAMARWDRGLTGTLTVELPAASAGNQDDGAIEQALKVLRTTPGVVRADAFDAKRTAELLAPWLGTGIDAADLPLPRLIDVEIEPRAGVDLAALGERLAAVVPGTQLDDHRRWLDRVLRTALAIEIVAGMVVALVGVAAVLAVIFATRTGLAVHHGIVEVLHLIGARDGYIARQFEWHALQLGVKGGLAGLVLAIMTLVGVAAAATQVGALGEAVRVLPALSAPAIEWVLLLLLPVAAGLVAMLTARITVLRALKRLP
ncbi:MAG TPA: cell division protein [Stellaceae bacterium]|jgi:cell division transport system permease protein|nr:cell division protein [Stellaceae bacterium]